MGTSSKFLNSNPAIDTRLFAPRPSGCRVQDLGVRIGLRFLGSSMPEAKPILVFYHIPGDGDEASYCVPAEHGVGCGGVGCGGLGFRV